MNLMSLFDSAFATKPQVKAAEAVPVKHEQFELDVEGRNIPVRICFEARYNNRVTVNGNGILIRIAKNTPAEEQRKQIDTFLKWAKTKLGEKPELLDYLPQRKYVNGEVLQVGAHYFSIHIIYNELNKSSARIHNNYITLSLARGLTKEAENSTCSYLISKCLSKFFLPIVSARIHELNNRYIGKKIASVKIKYNTSNWGSCSTHGNINISLRLMFAPQDVIDYVLIHELAHLIHPNHSSRFWKVVEGIMPNYREKEKHLEDNNYRYYL
jgi:predicted metal-dependent hydrolase